MTTFNRQQAGEKEELDRMTKDLQQSSLNTEHQSEPTAPPEYRTNDGKKIVRKTNHFRMRTGPSKLLFGTEYRWIRTREKGKKPKWTRTRGL